MFTKMTLGGIERQVRNEQVVHYESFGWTTVRDTEPVEQPTSQLTDSGPIKAKSRKANKPAETAPEAASENLGNANQQGE